VNDCIWCIRIRVSNTNIVNMLVGYPVGYHGHTAAAWQRQANVTHKLGDSGSLDVQSRINEDSINNV
jgi:hypothetical protein